jgi:hypothetical protein
MAGYRQETLFKQSETVKVYDLSEQECAYLAGLIDGEGYLTLHMKHFPQQKGIGCMKFHLTPHLDIAQDKSRMEHLKWLQFRIGGSFVMSESRHTVRFEIEGKDNLRGLLLRLLPYLRIKRRVAELLLEACKKLPTTAYRGASYEQWLRLVEIKEEIAAINSSNNPERLEKVMNRLKKYRSLIAERRGIKVTSTT